MTTEAQHQARRLLGRKNDPRFTPEQKITICHWIAEFATYKQVAERARAEFNVKVTENFFYFFRQHPKWTPIIDRFRAAWVKGIMEEPIAHKRTRLKALAKLIEHAERDPTSSPWRKRFEVAKYLDQARLEMDEKQTEITNLYLTQVTQYNEAELLQRRDQLLERIKTWRPAHGSPTAALPAVLRGDGLQTGARSEDRGGDCASEDPVGDGGQLPEHPAGGRPCEQGPV